MSKPQFTLEEATIDQLQSALKAGQVNCVEVVQRYIDRCRRYNGASKATSSRHCFRCPEITLIAAFSITQP